ncbi:MAG: hypothetical protein Fues2KO_51250 [Fuerstiella sp.]
MPKPESDSAPAVSYLIEHSHGTCELWLRRTEDHQITFYEPLRFAPISGRGTVVLKPEMVAQAIELDEWMADHMEVFCDGRVSD